MVRQGLSPSACPTTAVRSSAAGCTGDRDRSKLGCWAMAGLSLLDPMAGKDRAV